MASQFGKGSGPGSGPQAQNPIPQIYRPLSPMERSPREFEALESTYSPTLAFQSNHSVVGPSHPPAAVIRSFDSRTHQRPSTVMSSLPTRYHGEDYFPAKIAPVESWKRTRLSQVQSTDEDTIRNSRRRDARPPDALFSDHMQSVSQRTRSPPLVPGNNQPEVNIFPFFEPQRPTGPLFNEHMQPVPQRTRPPPLFPGNHPPAGNVGPFVELQSPPGVLFNSHMQSVPQRIRSRPQFPGKNYNGDIASPFVEPQRPALSSSVWGNQTRLTGNFSNSWGRQEQSPVLPHNTRKYFAIAHADAQVPNGTRSPPILSSNENTREDSHLNRRGSVRPFLSPPGFRTRSNNSNNCSDSLDSEIPHMSPPPAQSMENIDGAIKPANFPAPKRTRSPPSVSTGQVFQGNSSLQDGRERPFLSSPGFGTRSNNSNDPYISPHSEIPHMSPPSSQSIMDKASAVKPTNFQALKRTRSPPLLSTDQVFQGNSSAQDDSEREMQAKAKRLARFKVELSQPVESTTGIGDHNSNVNRHGQSLPARQKTMGKHSADVEGDFDGTVLPDQEGPKSTAIITGLCPDMCPVSEREERERKGDLDQYERLDGNRNQTSKSLAVKKYNRTAEREANLIRPMPVLKKTIDYLLYLLGQPYDDKFLGLYNFLWDRMRAVRMDLRMQHLFNLNAITMLEQMIRLHIIAMHELCEYTKGEGFSEGFDAHLNIEQMNKTSVELFQLYDDHRKKGVNVPTEKEFRGYYALLKLDKHPGYKVEPAELSLDLSKMTPEMRQTQEVLFARDVARACRTSNFIAFFRLARKASYLQACLMHAHFAKLRTQALASLHSGLQINQGIPVAHVSKWLAMEDEEIENLLEYHGFLIKEFDEPYMVKDGPFLNSENDFPLKCSELVHLKKSETIFEDVSSSHPTGSLVTEVREDQLIEVREQEPEHVEFVQPDLESPAQPIDEEMHDNAVVPSPKNSIKTSIFDQQSEKGNQMAAGSPLSWDFSSTHSSPKSPQARPGSLGKSHFDSIFRNSMGKKTQVDMKTIPMQIMSGRVDQEKIFSPKFNFTSDNSVSKMVIEDTVEDKEHTDSHHQDAESEEAKPDNHDEEVAEAKLRLIFRIWRRRSLRRRELREERQLAAMAALNSLSLGPPIRQRIVHQSTSSELNIDQIVNERYERHKRSWSSLNVSDVIADTLGARNPVSKCFSWKIIVCSQMDQSQDSHSIAGSWLLSKLMPTKKDNNIDLVMSSTNLSVWKKWVPSKLNSEPVCCLSIIKEAEFDNLSETVLGSNAVLFLVSETFSLEIQRLRLHNLISSLPLNSQLPLLIIVDSYEEDSDSSTVMAEKLGLNDFEKSRVRAFLVIFLKKNQQLKEFDGFFSDEELRRGLSWLADQSPLPPGVIRVKTHELIWTHLTSSLKVLDEMGVYEVGPDHCIMAFNEALHDLAKKVGNAADTNPCSWPCPEMDLLDKTSDEYEMVKLHLPETGWSSSDRIEDLTSALKAYELPLFEDDFSWLYKGSNLGKDIENQRVQLENCLIKYLTQSSKMMGLSLATNEALVLLQKNARLELHDSTYYIVPKWVMIFKRIFNWHLMGLTNRAISTAYALQHEADLSASAMEKMGIEDKSSSDYLTSPSLDEMIEICMENEAFQPSPLMVSDGSKAVKFIDFGNLMGGKLELDKEGNPEKTNNDDFIDQRLNKTTGGLVAASKATKEADKLRKLLEQCNILQDRIDKKLSIYF